MWFGDIDLRLRYPTTPPVEGIAPRRLQAARRRYLARRMQERDAQQRAGRDARLEGIIAWRRLKLPTILLKLPRWRRA